MSPTKPTETDKNRQKRTLPTSKTDETDKNRRKTTLFVSSFSARDSLKFSCVNAFIPAHQILLYFSVFNMLQSV